MNFRSILQRAVLAIVLLQARPSLADSITGTVRNQTTGTAAAGDDVVLLRLGEGMQEQARTKTDGQGAFTVPAPVATAQYVVRVLHQGVNYDQVATASSRLQITVYDVVSRIPGLSGLIGIAQIESDGKLLKVTEMYAIRNATNPPVTQSNPRNFTVFLPEEASLDSVEVKSGAGMWTRAPVDREPDARNQYAVNFPLRPGDTLFRSTYHLPYSGPTTLRLKLAYPIQKFAIMHPPSMSFRALHAKTFLNPGRSDNLQIEKAVSEPLSGDVPAFVISGIGSAASTARANPPQAAASPIIAPPQTAAPLNNAGAQPAARAPNVAPQPGKALWPIVAVAAALIAVLSLAVWRRRQRKNSTIKISDAKEPLLEALKEELFHLESERLHGSISAEEYASTKEALNVGIQRALAKKH
jgi:hypothetical protein